MSFLGHSNWNSSSSGPRWPFNDDSFGCRWRTWPWDGLVGWLRRNMVDGLESGSAQHAGFSAGELAAMGAFQASLVIDSGCSLSCVILGSLELLSTEPGAQKEAVKTKENKGGRGRKRGDCRTNNLEGHRKAWQWVRSARAAAVDCWIGLCMRWCRAVQASSLGAQGRVRGSRGMRRDASRSQCATRDRLHSKA